MADWLGGYSSEWRVSVVDQDTWADARDLDGVVKVSVSRDNTADVPLLETGSIEIDTAGQFPTNWLRVNMIVDGAERVPVATMLFERVSRHTERGSVVTARGRSVLQPAADMDLLYADPKGYAASGSDGAAYAARIIAKCTPAPVRVDGSFTLSDDVNFDSACKCLEAAWKVLKAGGFCIQIEGDGTVRVMPVPTEPSLELGKANAGLLIPGVDDDFSAVDVPNRYTAVLGGVTASAVNVDSGSDASYAVRRRWVDADRDTDPILVNGEDLQAYCERRLAEESTVTRRYSYTREYWPGIAPYSLVRATLRENGLEGDLRVMTQELECGAGVTVSETAGLEVRL